MNGLTGALQGFGTAQAIENLQLELAKQNTTSVVIGQMIDGGPVVGGILGWKKL